MGYYNMISIDSSTLRRLDDALFSLSQRAFPELRKEAVTEVGPVLLEIVNSQIAKSVNDDKGEVQSWQRLRYGSLGGYAAVSADPEMEVQRGRKMYRVALITNALEYGHIGRLPTGRNPKYKPRIETGRAPARKFYSNAFSRIENHAELVAKQIGYRMRQKFTEAMK